jgi:hypothetical protein
MRPGPAIETGWIQRFVWKQTAHQQVTSQSWYNLLIPVVSYSLPILSRSWYS